MFLAPRNPSVSERVFSIPINPSPQFCYIYVPKRIQTVIQKIFFFFSHKKFYFGAPAIVRFCISKNTAVKVPNPFLWLPWNEAKSKVHPVFSQSRIFKFTTLTTSSFTTYMVFLASFLWYNQNVSLKTKPSGHYRSPDVI